MYKSLYPSIMLEFNIAPNTQIGKINIPIKVYEHENTYHIEDEKYSRSGEFIENLVTDNIIEYCHRWFHLAGIEEFINDIDEFYGDTFGKFSNLENSGLLVSPIKPISSTITTPITFIDNTITIPITFIKDKPEIEREIK